MATRHGLGRRRDPSRSRRERLSAISLALLGALLLFLFAGCGDVKVRLGDSCADDSECGEGQICIDNACIAGCRGDADCRESGAGFYCVEGQCTKDGEDDPLRLVLSVGGSLRFEGPGEAVAGAVDEQSAGIALDTGESVYIGTGAVSWTWRVAQSPPDVPVTLTDTEAPRALLATPQVLADELVQIELTATYPEGSESVSMTLTIRNNLNEPPDVTVTGPTAPVAAGAAVTLEASATEPNGEELATPLAWEQTAGTAVPLVDASGDGSRWRVRFTAPSPGEDERLTFRVRVRDRHDPPGEGQAEVSVDVLAAPIGCTDDADCPAAGACAPGDCGPDGVCTTGTAADGTGCDDGDACTVEDACDGGVCAGTARDCDDADPCTTDGCTAATGACTHAAVPACCGTAADCADDDPCTTDTCDAATGVCGHAPIVGCCHADADCDDDDACTNDDCIEATGLCAHPALPGCCDDDGDCDDGEVCTADTCDTGSGDCSYGTVPDCCRTAADCGDGDVCTTDSCDAVSGACGHAEVASCCRSEADCDDDDVCTTDSCDEETGACGHAERPDCCRSDEECADADPCTDDRCNTATGVCSHPAAAGCCAADADCDDADPCTADTCDEDSGDCAHAEVADCCRSNAECDDQDVCTADTCDTATGACANADREGCCRADADCGDGDVCTTDTCDEPSGVCSNLEVAGCCRADADCGDGDVCTTDTCDAPSGVCSNLEVADCCRSDADCGDGDVCTTDTCDEPSGVCSNAAVPGCCRSAADCLDENPCTEDVCEQTTGVCSNPAIAGCCLGASDCDDQEVCTTDVCDTQAHACEHFPVQNCCHAAAECDDGNPCTTNGCAQNQCVYPARPWGAPCPAPDGSEHGAICDSAATCQPFTRDVYPDELLWTTDERHYAFWLNDVYREGGSGAALAVGRQWYYRFLTVRAPINEERGIVLSLDGGEIRELVWATRGGAYTGLHEGLAVGPGGVAYQDGAEWTDVAAALQLGTGDYAGAQDVWGGPTSVFCCPSAWIMARQDLGPLRIDRDVNGRWSARTLFYDPAVRPTRARVWGFSYDPDPTDRIFALQMLDTYLFLDEGDVRSVRWAEQPDPELGLKPGPPGCDPTAGEPCADAAPWRDAFGLRQGTDNIVWAVGDAGTIQYRSDEQGGWKAVQVPAAALGGFAAEDIDWYGVAVLREHAFLVGIAHGCGTVCPLNVDQAASVVFLHVDRAEGRPSGLVVLDSYACSNLGLGGLRLCELFPADSLRVGDVWVSESDDGLLDVWVVGGWPQFDDDRPQDVRAALWHVRPAP